MDSHMSNLLRRSRQPHQRAAANLNLSLEKNAIEDRSLEALAKRLTPEQLSAIQADARAAATRTTAQTSAAATRNPATPATVATEAVGGVASRIQPSPSATSSSAAAISAAVPTSQVVPSSSSAVRSSSTSTSSARPSSSSTSTIRSTSSAAPPSSSSTRNVLTITSSRALPSSSSTTSSASMTSASAAAASQSSESTGLGTGAFVGIAIACLVGLVILGSCVGWVYRKHAQRKYSDVKSPWSKLDDHHDVTPFPPGNSEKPYLGPDEDIYGHSPAPVIGSRRALALARQNGFNADGTVRPDSEYMFQRDNNAAGYGAGHGLGAQYGAYPTMNNNINNGYDYGRPTQDYGPPSPGYEYDQDQTGMAISAPGNTRQLVGPHGYTMPAPLAPVAMGRPAPPQSAAEFADREEYMDLPAPTPTGTHPSSAPHLSQYSTYGLAYAESEPDYTPHTATTAGWSGDAKIPQSAIGAHTPLPAIEPASPLMSSFDFKRQSRSLGPIASNFANKYGASGTSNDTSTLPMYEDEDETRRQKRMYGEVASAAGVQEPTTPHSADLNHSTNSYETASSFSAHQPESRSISHRLPPAPMPQLPIVNLIPPQPYQHGRPLSPLTEVETPRSVVMPSSSLLHGQEINPFEEAMPPPPSALRYPQSAVSSTGATAFPSPAFPPPSPGGMSVPGSVSDSPRNRRESMFDGDDAYGGI